MKKKQAEGEKCWKLIKEHALLFDTWEYPSKMQIPCKSFEIQMQSINEYHKGWYGDENCQRSRKIREYWKHRIIDIKCNTYEWCQQCKTDSGQIGWPMKPKKK